MADNMIKPVTVDCRKSGYQDLYHYIQEYAKVHTKGRPAAAILDIIRDHQQNNINRSDILVVQSGRVLSRTEG